MADVRLRDLNPAEFNYGVNVAGSLGVGTTSPAEKLHVNGGDIIVENNSSTTVDLRFRESGSDMLGLKYHAGSSPTPLDIYNFNTSATLLRVDENGKVGINTTSTAARLVVAGNSDSGDAACSIHIIDNDSTSGSAVPNISFRSGASTQIYQVRANDTLGLAFRNSSDATKVVFDDDGKVGIGETDPAYQLHVNSGSTGTVAQFKSSSTTAKIMFNNSGSNACFLGSQNNNLFFQTNSTNRMFISTAGNVGIGTTTPVAHLTVGDGTSHQTISIDKGASSTATLSFLNAGSTKVYLQADSSEHLRIATNNAVHMSILENGNVGIGHTSPTAKLHVDGDLIVTGTVDVGSSGFNVSSGFILPFGGGTAPSGWLECNGAAVSRSTYSDLFAIIGTIYGAGDGSTTFNVPDLQGRVMMGEGGNTAARTPADLESIGDTGGSQSVALVVDNLPSHSHRTFDGSHGIQGFGRFSEACGDNQSSRLRLDGGGYAGRGCNQRTKRWFGVNYVLNNTGPIGADTAHDNIQPSIVINYLIKT